jgi:DNA-damage-inducible protein J
MPKDATINARVDSRLKAKAEKVLAEVGLTTSEVITLLLHQIVLRRGLPFEARIPNEETRAAIAELEAGGGERFDGSAAELSKHLLAPPRRS